jgi:hypothetical protein
MELKQGYHNNVEITSKQYEKTFMIQVERSSMRAFLSGVSSGTVVDGLLCGTNPGLSINRLVSAVANIYRAQKSEQIV